MPRYQMTPWSTGPGLDRERALSAVRAVEGARLPMFAAPIMAHCDAYGRSTGATWRGTNQPPVLAFSAPDDETARKVRDAYGDGICFVENRKTTARV